ncbi:hypothetical protein SAMN02982919_02535 [Giesbergeria anulus]|uniref:Uncharacterized protein n=1 Tax=Giesbergeria anulus TaxID=180197 RepID=A0A1H9PW35_9BURK|nr:hypothetical protein SAMN02982919_02535 [Giesbergeria anulus]
MEWPCGIVVSRGELWATVESTNGATSLVALKELYRRGLPPTDKTVRRMVTVNFRDFFALRCPQVNNLFRNIDAR